jgi:hypothetical protein
MSQVISLKVAKVFENKFDNETVLVKLVRDELVNSGGINIKVKKTYYLPNAQKSEALVEGNSIAIDMSIFKSENREVEISTTNEETGEVESKKVTLTYLRV